MNDTNRRLFITIFLCLAFSYAWVIFVEPRFNPPVPAEASAADAGALAAAPDAGQPAVVVDVPRGTLDGGVALSPVVAAPRPPNQVVILSTDKLRVELTSDGAALRSAQLLGSKYLHASVHGAERKPVELVAVGTSPLPLSLEISGNAAGAEPAAVAAAFPSDTGYEVVEKSDRSVTFRGRANGLEVLKTISLDPQAYKIELSVKVQSAQAFSGRVSILSTGWSDPSSGSGGFLSSYFSSRVQPPQAICKAGKESEQLQVAKPKSWAAPSQANFAGINEQFFLVALVPGGEAGACRLSSLASGALTAALDLPLTLPAGGSQKLPLTAFAGPKLGEALDQVSPLLRESIDFGFWGIIVKGLLVGMRFFHDAIPPHNWGLAIILLTLSIKLVTFPLTHKQMKSMQEMQRIQPQLDELKKKYAGDTARQNQEQMKLFQEHGVNPMASCLPMLVQFPIWIALYNTLRVSAELYNSAFIPGWLDDLTAKDPYFIVPAVMGVTMIITQILTPTPTSNPSQKTVTYAMSAFFTLAMFNLPSGLTLYILVNNVLSITQQIYLRRTLKIGTPPAALQTVEVGRK